MRATPRHMHQNAMATLLLDPNGNGAPATTNNKIQVGNRLRDQRSCSPPMRIMSCGVSG